MKLLDKLAQLQNKANTSQRIVVAVIVPIVAYLAAYGIMSSLYQTDLPRFFRADPSLIGDSWLGWVLTFVAVGAFEFFWFRDHSATAPTIQPSVSSELNAVASRPSEEQTKIPPRLPNGNFFFGGKRFKIKWRTRIICSLIAGPLLTGLGIALLIFFDLGKGGHFAHAAAKLGYNMSFAHYHFWMRVFPGLRVFFESHDFPASIIFLISSVDNAALALLLFSAGPIFRHVKPNKASDANSEHAPGADSSSHQD